MHIRDRSTATVLRRASTGPHALMLRRTLAPYVPDRGGDFVSPARRRVSLGASSLVQSAGSVYTGAAAGAAVTGTSIASAVGAAAAAGSFVPVIGTVIGAIIGLVASGVFNHRVDPEVGNFNAAVQLYNMQGPAGILNIADKYLVLAGLFDLEPGQIKGNIPIYKKYGRMGEQRFTQDMANLIYSAAQSGQITANDTVQSVFDRIVMPWINGFGYGAMQDRNGEMINAILLGLTAEYITGLWRQRWFARSGDMPNWQIPTFSLPASPSVSSSAPAPTASATPSPVPVSPSNVIALDPELQGYRAGRNPSQGARINYTLNTSGQFDRVPSGTSYWGMDLSPAANGAWIVQNGGQLYRDVNGSLTPYQTAASIQPVLPVTTPQQIVPSSPVVTGPANPVTAVTGPQTVFVPSSAGGGFIPIPSQPSNTVTRSTGFNPEWLLWGGAGALMLILLLRRKRTLT